MDYAEAAFLAEREGDANEASSSLQAAFKFERKAARMVAKCYEPTRSVLYRSAASLALQCGYTEEALELIEEGLAGEPPQEIADELIELKEAVQSRVEER